MCGLYGYYLLHSTAKLHPKFTNLASELLKHRGPDAQAFKQYANRAGMGHLRLAIIDTKSQANQPMETQASSLIFNGEIYNYLELKKTFKRSLFNTTSDTEVLQAGLDQQGISFLNQCNGMFALAYYHFKTKQLTLIRDRFGVKPLYYLIKDHILYFASEMKPLLAILKKITKNKHYYQIFMEDTATDYDDTTFVNEIFQLQPGHYLVCTPKGWSVKIWYHGQDFSYNTSLFSNTKKTIDYIEDLLINAIDIRLRADVPLCITLSGGLDSTIIYTLIKEKLHRDIQPFTFIQPDSPNSEEKKVSLLVQRYHDEFVPIQLPQYQDLKTIEKILNHLDFPSWSASILTYWYTYQEIAKRGFKVILEGHGSDEQLGGYPYMVQAAYQEALASHQYLQAYHRRSILQKMLGQPFLDIAFFKSLLLDGIYYLRGKPKQKFQQVVETAFDYKILPIVLRTFDRMSMAHSLESRSPFMDYRLVEVFRHLPIEYKINQIGSKAILRTILKRYHQTFLFQDMNKQGFGFDEKFFYQDSKNRAFLKKSLQKNDLKPDEHRQQQAVQYLKKPTLSSREIEVIWKAFALSLVEKKYFNS